MELVVFLRGVDVGGRRRFQPSLLARELAAYDVVNIGTAGTFVVRRPGARAKFVAELQRRLPFLIDLVCCEGAELLALKGEHPFVGTPTPGLVPFLSILAEDARLQPAVPLTLPPEGEWQLRLAKAIGRYVF